MSHEDPDRDRRLFEIALRVTDDLPVDWGLERTGVPDEDASFESLALIAEIGAELRSAPVATEPARLWKALDRPLDWMRRLSRIRHPNLAVVHDVEARDGRLGAWCEPMRGCSLEEDLRTRGAMGAREAVLIGIDLCAGLEAMHARGLTHGAVDTNRVFREGVPGGVRNAGRIVLGFDPVATAGHEGAAAEARSPTPADDLHAVGALLYRLLTRCDPATSEPSSDPSGRDGGLRSLRPDLPVALVRVIEQALAADPAHRPRDSGAMQRALLQVLGLETRSRRRLPVPRWRWRWVLAAAAVAGLAVVGNLGRRDLRKLWHRPPHVAALSTRLRLPVIGSEPAAWFGYYSGAGAGDLNADGAPDLVWGASLAGDGRGRVYVLFGGRGADAKPDLALQGSGPAEQFGNSVAGLGDVNGDGGSDFAVAACYDDAILTDAGRVEIHFGGSGLDTRPDVFLRGHWPAGGFGSWIAGPGDLNDDGYDDLLVSAPCDGAAGPNAGRVFVFFGGAAMDSIPDLELTSYTSGASFGQVVAGAGDVNGDGHRDVIVGSDRESADGERAGRAYVFFGGPGLDARPDVTLPGHAPGEGLMKVAGVGDVNGDAFDDLAVGAEYGVGREPGSGLVYVYFGGPNFDATADVVLLGERAGDLFGCWVAGAGDLNRDGCNDVMVGARRCDANQRNSGAAYVYFGGKTMDAECDLRFMGEASLAEMGSACGPVGDFFGDGWPDLFITSHGSSVGGRDAGRIDVYDVSRYAILAPSASEPLRAASKLDLRWAGSEPADVSLSVDGRKSWSLLARGAGGQAENRLMIEIPPAASESLVVRLVPADASVPGDAEAVYPPPIR